MRSAHGDERCNTGREQQDVDNEKGPGMDTFDDLRGRPPKPPLHGSPEDGSSSVGCCPEPVAVSPVSAQQIAMDPACELVRWALEARIVAHQSAGDIAFRMGLPTVVIDDFERKHFQVRHRLRYSSLVLHEVIGVPTDEVWTPGEVARFWQWLGFRYGVASLDLVIPPGRQTPGSWADGISPPGVRCFARVSDPGGGQTRADRSNVLGGRRATRSSAAGVAAAANAPRTQAVPDQCCRTVQHRTPAS